GNPSTHLLRVKLRQCKSARRVPECRLLSSHVAICQSYHWLGFVLHCPCRCFAPVVDAGGTMDGAAFPESLAQEGLRIDYREVAELIPYARNARTHSEAQVALIAGSIREYGFTNPVLVDGANGIIAGHGRVLAARKLGLSRVPVIELAHLSEAQKRAYVLADNRLAEQAGWDRDLLALELGDLREMAVDLASLGFEAGELDALLNTGQPDAREEDVPEAPAVVVSRP